MVFCCVFSEYVFLIKFLLLSALFYYIIKYLKEKKGEGEDLNKKVRDMGLSRGKLTEDDFNLLKKMF